MTRTDRSRTLALILTGLLLATAGATAKVKLRPVVHEWAEQPALCLPLGARVFRKEGEEVQRYHMMEAVADSAFQVDIVAKMAALGLSWTMADPGMLAADPVLASSLSHVQDVLAKLTLDLVAARLRAANTVDTPVGKPKNHYERPEVTRDKQMEQIRKVVSETKQTELAAALADHTDMRWVVIPSYFGLSKNMAASAGDEAKGMLKGIALAAAASAMGASGGEMSGGGLFGECHVAFYILDLQSGAFTDRRLTYSAQAGAGSVKMSQSLPTYIARIMKTELKTIKKQNKTARKELARLEKKGK
ncbi:MAG: hypothetical protein Q8O14_04215 [bacterium]|jgi:cell pole-organizing protein PopZ|nr:hypothetical protein [bacterium]